MNVDDAIQIIIDNQINKDFVFASLDVPDNIPRNIYKVLNLSAGANLQSLSVKINFNSSQTGRYGRHYATIYRVNMC